MSDDTGSKVHDILLFLAVVEAGSFTLGGKGFGLSRSAAGKAVARLEDRYGTRLLNRTTRSIDLTLEGRQLYDHGLTIRSAISVADMGMSTDAGIPRGTLRITAPDAIGRKLLLPVVAQFLKDWDSVQVEISFSDRVDSLVEEGFDVAIRIGVTTPSLGLIARTILTDEPLLCAAPSYFSTRSRPQNAEQLTRHDLLQFASRGSRQGWHLQENDGTWVRAQGRTRLRLESGEGLREAALAGMGIALLPKLLIGADLKAERLERILPSINCGTLPIVALYPHKRHLEPRVRRFLDLLVDTLQKERRNNSGALIA